MKTQAGQRIELAGGSPPEVWWGEQGIDALLWADPPPPYGEPSSQGRGSSSEALRGGEAR